MDEKKDELQLTPPLSVVRGRQVKAEYAEQPIEEYQGNPLIEALPPLWSMSQVGTMLAYYPPYNESQRELPGEVRLHLLENAREFFIPQAIHYEIFLAISNMIRRGYIGRNPVANFARAKQSADIQRLEREIQRRVFLRSKARGLLIVGPGGMGKSTAVENILSLFPQVITHTNYSGQDFILKQLVWIKLQCPGDGSLRGLCINFLQEVDDILGTNYMKFYGAARRTVDELLLIIARVSSLHCVGVVVFDEVQDLSEAKSGGAARMLNFFVQLENTLGIPFVLIATPKAEALFDSEFRHARRVSEQGDIFWRPMQEIAEKLQADEPERADSEWEDFVRATWRYWYLKTCHPLPTDIMKDKAVRLLYETSQGITALVVTIFFLAQRRAIISGKEDLTEGVIKSAVRDNLFLVGRMLDELKVGPLRSQNKKGSRRGASDLNRSHWERRRQSTHRAQTVAATKPPDPIIDQEAKNTMREQSAPSPSERKRRDSGRNTKTHGAGDLRGLTLEKKGRPSNSANPEIMAAPDEFAP
jgi:hypothetical protein